METALQITVVPSDSTTLAKSCNQFHGNNAYVVCAYASMHALPRQPRDNDVLIRASTILELWQGSHSFKQLRNTRVLYELKITVMGQRDLSFFGSPPSPRFQLHQMKPNGSSQSFTTWHNWWLWQCGTEALLMMRGNQKWIKMVQTNLGCLQVALKRCRKGPQCTSAKDTAPPTQKRPSAARTDRNFCMLALILSAHSWSFAGSWLRSKPNNLSTSGKQHQPVSLRLTQIRKIEKNTWN